LLPFVSPEHPLRPLGAFLLVLVHFAAFMTVGLIATAAAELGGGEDPLLLLRPENLIAGAVVGPLAALYVGLRRQGVEASLAQALRLGRPTGRQASCLVPAILVGAAFAPLSNAITVALSGAHVSGVDAVAPVPAALALVAYPVAAEMLYRGFIQPRLVASVGVWRGLLVTVTLFMLGQLNPLLMPSGLLLGIVFGVLAWRTGTTWVALFAHLGHQACRLFLLVPASTSVGLTLGIGCGALAVIGALGRPSRDP
jgi:membrane protease YdiL (CAAX protease family)